MLSTWKKIIHESLYHKNFLHISGKRISRTVTVTSSLPEFLNPDLDLNMLGYTQRKISMLSEYYYVKDSVEVALSQLALRRKANTYGSSAVTCYGHFAKKERPTHGPCMQSLAFTHVPPGSLTHVDLFYRSTEVFKKFAADLIWLTQVMLPQFELSKGTITFHFANVTWHPQYWSVLVPYLDDPVKELLLIKKHDEMIYRGICRWTWRFLNNDPSLENFRQGFRVAKHLHRLCDPLKLEALKKHVNKAYTPKKFLIETDEDEI